MQHRFNDGVGIVGLPFDGNGTPYSATLHLTLVEKVMADVEQFRDDLKDNADGLMGGSRGDFMQTLGEAVYARITGDQLDRMIAVYLTLQDVVQASVDSPDNDATRRSTARPMSSMKWSAGFWACNDT